MVHLDLDVGALAGAEQKSIHELRGGHRVAVKGDGAHLVSGQGDAAVLDGAGVQKMNQQLLAVADTDGLAGAEGLVVDRVSHGVDFEAIGRSGQDRRLFQDRDWPRVVVGVHHVQRIEGLPVAKGEEKLLIVTAGVARPLDVDKAELACVGAFVQIVHGHGVSVIPAAAGRTRGELIAPSGVRFDNRRALFFGAIDLGRDEHAMPVDEFRRVGIVEDIDGDGLAFLEAQHRSGSGAVVANGGENVRGVELDRDGGDAKGDVSTASVRLGSRKQRRGRILAARGHGHRHRRLLSALPGIRKPAPCRLECGQAAQSQ